MDRGCMLQRGNPNGLYIFNTLPCFARTPLERQTAGLGSHLHLLPDRWLLHTNDLCRPAFPKVIDLLGNPLGIGADRYLLQALLHGTIQGIVACAVLIDGLDSCVLPSGNIHAGRLRYLDVDRGRRTFLYSWSLFLYQQQSSLLPLHLAPVCARRHRHPLCRRVSVGGLKNSGPEMKSQ